MKEQVIDQVIKLKQQNLYLNKVNELKSEYEVEIF